MWQCWNLAIGRGSLKLVSSSGELARGGVRSCAEITKWISPDHNFLCTMQAPPDLAATVFRDDPWLAAYPLNRATVLDYFSNSPFYVLDCNNERAKQQGLDVTHLP